VRRDPGRRLGVRAAAALLACLLALPGPAAGGEEPQRHLSRFGEGAGPAGDESGLRLLDEARTPRQSNAVAFDAEREGAFEAWTLKARLRVLPGGDGGSFLFLDTSAFGRRGPAPFLESWVEPNLRRSFAVAIDVHNPPSREMFTVWGNYQDLPQREVSLHFDGRELVKRVAPREFRGDFADLAIEVRHVVGGAEVTVRLAGEAVYDRHFVAGMSPYECRLAIGAGTRADATTAFDVADLVFEQAEPAAPRRPPLRVEVFNHVLTDNKRTAYEREVTLPPPNWALGRVLMAIDIHDAGEDWDEWDRNGEVSVFDDEGKKRGIVPFITSYRTPCRWLVDVTHFRPLLTGRRRIEIAAGTTFYKNRGYMMSLSLEFHHGQEPLEPWRVVPLWNGTAHYRSAENHFRDFFPPLTVPIDAEAKAARLFLTTTGHSQVGEFTPARRTIVFEPGAGGEPVRSQSVVWRPDCYLNPNRPQFGTWQFSRAGWAPGDVVHPLWIDLSAHVRPGAEAVFRYEPEPYDFAGEPEPPTEAQIAEASHVVRSYLVLYREGGDRLPAPTLRVATVEAGSNADKAGVRVGDWLSTYDGAVVSTLDELRAALQGALSAGKESVTLVLYRDDARVEIPLPAGRMGIGLGNR